MRCTRLAELERAHLLKLSEESLMRGSVAELCVMLKSLGSVFDEVQFVKVT